MGFYLVLHLLHLGVKKDLIWRKNWVFIFLWLWWKNQHLGDFRKKEFRLKLINRFYYMPIIKTVNCSWSLIVKLGYFLFIREEKKKITFLFKIGWINRNSLHDNWRKRLKYNCSRKQRKNILHKDFPIKQLEANWSDWS